MRMGMRRKIRERPGCPMLPESNSKLMSILSKLSIIYMTPKAAIYQ